MRLLTARPLLILLVVLGAAATPAAAQARTRDIVCESTGNQFKKCTVQTGGNVQLVQTISNTRCEFQRTWGFDQDGIWVDRGCRGRFRIGGTGVTPGQPDNWGIKLVCESSSNRYQLCPAETGGDVRLSRQLSSESCVAGRSWGIAENGIWVSNGCRAEFEIGYSNQVGGNRPPDEPVKPAGPATGVEAQARAACQGKGRALGYGSITTTASVHTGSLIRVHMRGSSQSRQVDLECTYRIPSKTATITRQSQVGFTPGGGSQSDLYGRAAQACAEEARRQGFEIRGSGPSKLQAWGVLHSMALRRGGYNYDRASCNYVSSTGRTTISAGPTGGGGGGNDSELYRRAEQACDAEARRQGYTVLQSGPGRLESWGVHQSMELRRAGVDYRGAVCDYQSNVGRVTISPGQVGELPPPRAVPAPQPR